VSSSPRSAKSKSDDILSSVPAEHELRQIPEDIDTRDGISLLSLKPHLMLSYLTSLTLLSASRALGASVFTREPPSELFSDSRRGSRGDGAGDLVDSMVEGRIVLEKIKPLESRMRYQIEKLVRLAQEAPSKSDDVTDGTDKSAVVSIFLLNRRLDPLAFRPNPAALMDAASDDEGQNAGGDDGEAQQPDDGIYHPPKLAPMPYTEAGRKEEKERRRPVPAAVASLAHLDPTRPYAEGTSGLGAAPAANAELATGRMKELRRMTEFEEENFTRLVMKKKDARQRRRGGLEDEFGEVLRSVGRSTRGAVGDGYEELRERGRKDNVLVRSRKRGGDDDVEVEGPKIRKKSRFDREAKAMKKRAGTKRK
jgi:U3 small nucleolar ribonucleoprotein protein LCP5